MELQELIAGARDVISVKRVYGEPYEKNGLTVIPAATVRGGGGGGTGDNEEESAGGGGGGGGFGVMARPAGAWIVEEGNATWKPAVDVNRIVLGGQMIALTAILITGRILLAHSQRRRSLTERIPQLPRRGQLHLRLPKAVH